MDLREIYEKIHASINEIDEKLDSAGDQKAAGKRKITNELIEESKETWEPVVNRLVEQLSEAPVEIQIGVYYGIVRGLNNKFSANLASEVEKIVEAQPKPEVVELSAEEVKLLSETRSELYKKLKTLIETANNFGEGDGMELPKRRTGAKGKRGPRAITFFSWSVDGEDVENLKAVVDLYDQYEKVSALTKAMREAKINLTKPEDRIEFTLPDGKVLVGIRTATPVESDDSEDDDDSDDEDDD